MKIHTLKTHPEPFDAMRKGLKPFEIRNNDRAYEVGDLLLLRRFDPDKVEGNKYDGSALLAAVKYVLPGNQYGLEKDYVALGLDVLQTLVAGRWLSFADYLAKKQRDRERSTVKLPDVQSGRVDIGRVI
jgi:hypothetical protein